MPTMAWVWDDEWRIEKLFNGAQLQMSGWTYAVDFPADYHESKGFTSCVRRRKWIRNRKYVAINSWSAVPSLGSDVTEEPFMDISVGGYEISGGDEKAGVCKVYRVYWGRIPSCEEGKGILCLWARGIEIT